MKPNCYMNFVALAVALTVPTTWAAPAQHAYVKASNTGAGDQFGTSVAISGDTVVVGARSEDSNATGVNGDQSDNSAPGSGAAYVFTGFCPGPRLSITREGGGVYYVIRFNGDPHCIYRLERAPAITGPWNTIATFTAPAGAIMEYIDTIPPEGSAFFRTSTP